MDTKIEIKQEPYLLEAESIARISCCKVIHSPDIYIKNGPAFLSSSVEFQSEIQRQASEMDMKIEIKEEPISLETTSAEGKFESEVTRGSNIHVKNEPAFLSSEFQSEGEIQRQASEMDMKIEIKEEPISMETSAVGKFESEVTRGSDIHIKNEPAFLSSDDEFQSEGEIQRQASEMDMKIEIKEEPIGLETTSTEGKFESEVTRGSDIHIKNEPALSSDDEFQSNYEIYKDDNEIKFTPVYLEKEKDKISEQYQEYTISSRLDTEAVENCESVTISAGLGDWLKLGEKSSFSHEKCNTIKAPVANITGIFSEDDKTPHKCRFCGKCFNLASRLQTHIVTHLNEMKPKSNVRRNNITKASQLGKHNLILKSKRLFKCNKCDKSYLTPLLLRAHNLFHEVNNKHDQCKQSFTSLSDLENHNLVHKVQKSYKCDQCEQSFTSSSDLENHNLVHKVQKSYKCDKCEQSFSSLSDLENHSLVHKVQKSYNCNQCEWSFTSLSDLENHSLVHKVQKSYNCDQSEQSFISSSDLENHSLVHKVQKSYKCDQCEWSFTSLSGLENHSLVHKVQKSYKCDQCEWSFIRSSDLENHSLVHKVQKSYNCDQCEWSFTSSSELENHNLVHKVQKSYKCDQCEQSFTSSSDLKTHKVVHKVKKSYKCFRCGESFPKALHLKAHKLVHKGERPLKCDQCRKGFTKLGALRRHKLAHEGKSPHKCEHCQKCFSKAPRLKKHMLIHSSEKRYKCDICQKSYTNAPSLRAHILSHEGKRHKCDICKKKFTAASYLKDHILIHEGKGAYKCNICHRISTSASNLKYHIATHDSKRLTTTEKAFPQHIPKSITQ